MRFCSNQKDKSFNRHIGMNQRALIVKILVICVILLICSNVAYSSSKEKIKKTAENVNNPSTDRITDKFRKNSTSAAAFKAKLKKKFNSKPITNPYEDWENVVSKSGITWADFLNLPLQTPRKKLYIKPSVLNSLIQCPSTVASTDAKCNELWGDSFVTSWRSRKVPELCEETAASKIHCYDSIGKSRYCIFENAMMNFKKVRKRKHEGTLTRSWERGFLSAECGDMGKDDIGYLALYKPDIEGQGDAVCDYVFNETVIAYSHENIRNFGQVVTDYMNIWTMLWLSGVSQQSKDVSFLNIDAIKKGKYFGDQPNQFFKHYEVSFRRILKAADFAETNGNVCFKKLIMQPRPLLHFKWEGNSVATTNNVGSVTPEDVSAKCSPYLMPSSMFQRFNLQIRNNYGLLSSEEGVGALTTNNQIKILLITRSIQSTVSDAAGNTVTGAVDSGVPTVSSHITSRLFVNTLEIINAIESVLNTLKSNGDVLVPMELVTVDVAQLPFEEQVKLLASVSVVVGMHGSGIAGSMHMAVGSKYCCGVIEIFPESVSAAGYGYMARRMGHSYERIDISSGSNNGSTSVKGSVVPVREVSNALHSVLNKILHKGSSCFVTSVINAPYL